MSAVDPNVINSTGLTPPIQTPITLDPGAFPSVAMAMWMNGITQRSAAAQAQVLVVTATGPTTITSPGTPTNGSLLVLFLTQDGTGGHPVTFSSDFRIPPAGLSRLANSITIALFVGAQDPADSVYKWWTLVFLTNKS